MGNTNCKSCNCTQFFDKKIELDLKSTSVPSQAPAFDPKPKLSLSKSREKLNLEHLRPLIPKLQALWLGHTARNYVTHLKRQTRPNHNYFNRNEIMETLSSKVGLGKFRQKKKPYKYASGAVYTGEWLGGFRDGFGTMEWPDGAKYQGNWSYSKPFGYGTFTHVDVDTYDGDWKICFVSPKDTFGTASNLNRWKDMVSDGYLWLWIKQESFKSEPPQKPDFSSGTAQVKAREPVPEVVKENIKVKKAPPVVRYKKMPTESSKTHVIEVKEKKNTEKIEKVALVIEKPSLNIEKTPSLTESRKNSSFHKEIHVKAQVVEKKHVNNHDERTSSASNTEKFSFTINSDANIRKSTTQKSHSPSETIREADAESFTGFSYNGSEDLDTPEQPPQDRFLEMRNRVSLIESSLMDLKKIVSEISGPSKNDKGHNFLQKKYPNGSIYIGEFKGSTKDGRGKFIWSGGDTYEGEWKDDKQHGRGRSVWVNGNTYIGYFDADEKSGIGEYIWNDGSCYLGEWRENKMNGIGRHRWNDGREYIGEWSDGNRKGIGILKYRNGNKYEGDFSKGKPHGNGTLFEISGRVMYGEWKNGKLTQS